MRSVFIAFAMLVVSPLFASAAPQSSFSGTWLRPCGRGGACLVSINNLELTFKLIGQEVCTWSVDMLYDRHEGTLLARDPYGNFGFYLDLKPDGSLYVSGTMIQNCGPMPLDQVYEASQSSSTQTASLPTAMNEADMTIVDYRIISDHNGSEMLVNSGDGVITYFKPKASISDTVKVGTLLFKADAEWDPYDDAAEITGTAYVFKKGCEPAPYRVKGHHAGWHTIVLKGAVPVREKNGCKVIAHKMNGNSTLTFASLGE